MCVEFLRCSEVQRAITRIAMEDGVVVIKLSKVRQTRSRIAEPRRGLHQALDPAGHGLGVSAVSFISRYVALMPGDLIYTGTPGTTARMSPGDVVEVEIEGIGILRNKIAAAGSAA